ncbi:hypothetical protein GFS31_24890 [Leptolyngbya sp. BL0902]|uniref:VCBS domain-containing protein n=1 Tax=Leptolyngbya sp. BL0902 TaxID=1115757 RepID=UPI0018E7D3A3|nr:VCBS domain-containing protein [Leptolyngbya sp. BL0902]QQE65799.1 hypothetical protein GFS31_24890 [Leptolyngbya sp. BL0902]
MTSSIEFAPTSSEWVNLPRTGDTNKGATDGVWTANASDLVGNDANPYLQIQADGNGNIAFKVLAEPQSGNFKALMGIFVDVDGDGSPDFTIQLDVVNVTGGYTVGQLQFIPILTGITAEANTRPNNTVIPAANSGTYFNLKDGSQTQPDNVRVFGFGTGADGFLNSDVDGDGSRENYYVFSFSLAQLDTFRNLVANTYNGGTANSVYKEIPQWPTDQTRIYAAGLTASNSLNAINGDIGGGPYTTSSTWRDIFGYQPPLPPIAANDAATVLEDGGPVTGNLLANDSDPNNDPLRVSQFVLNGTTYTLNAGNPSQTVILAGVGTFTLGQDGSYSFTPIANYAGPVPLVTYTVSDGALSSTATLAISITPVNDAPTAASSTLTINEDTGYAFSANDFGFADPNDTPANGFQSVVITTLPTAGTLTLNGVAVIAGQEISVANLANLVYTPGQDENGNGYASFTFQVRDNGGTANGGTDLSAPSTITFDVTPVNDAPVANVDTAIAREEGFNTNTSTVITPGINPSGNVLDNDTDVDAGDTKTVASIFNPVTGNGGSPVAGSTSTSSAIVITGAYGNLVLGADGSYIYEVDNANPTVQALRLQTDTLTETFTYTVRDAAGATSTSTLTVTIQGANDAPVANDDFNFATGTAGSMGTEVVSGNVLTNDTDVDAGDTKALAGTSASANGTSPGATVTTTITLASVLGIEVGRFVRYSSDGSTLKDAGGNNITVTAINGNTVTLSGGGTTSAVSNGLSLLFATVPTGNGTTPVTTTVSSFVSATAPSNTINLSAIDGTVVAGMTITGIDAGGNAFTRTVTAVTSNSITIDGAALSVSTTSPALSFTNTISGPVTLIGQFGTLSLNHGGVAGAYVYTPNNGLAAGTYADTFNYTMQDALGATSSATLTINLQVQPAPPTANPDIATAIEVGNGIAGTNPSGNVITGPGGVDVGSTLSVQRAWASTTTTETNVGTNTVINGQYGTLTISSTGEYTYTLNNTLPAVEALRTATDTLTETFFYRLTNGTQTDVTTLTITIQGSNDAPIATADTATATEAGGTDNTVPGFNPSGNVLANDTDVDAGDTKTVSAASVGAGALTNLSGGTITLTGTYGNLVLNADGSYTYTLRNGDANVNALAAGQSVNDVFTYQMQDTAGALSTSTLTITVNGANDAPINTTPASITAAEGIATSIVGISVGDPDNNPSQTLTSELATVRLTVNHGSLTIGNLNGATISSGGNGTATLTLSGTQEQINAALATLSYQGDAYFSGSDSLTVVSTDGLGLSDTSTIALNVTPDNRALTVSSPTVNEASPYAVFTVDGVVGQKVGLSLTGLTATLGADFSPNLEYWDGTKWAAYTGVPVEIPGTNPGGSASGGQLFVRTAILDDEAFEGSETFRLTATNTAGTQYNGTGTIRDDGTGLIFNNNGVSDGSANGSVTKDDDRPLTVSSPTVNEASPFIIFEVGGAANQWVQLALNGGSATLGTDFGDTLQYWNGTAWVNYTANSLIQLPNSGPLLVRTTITNDGTYEGAENFGLTATNTGGGVTQGIGTIVDDGTGEKFTGDVDGNGNPVKETTGLDNDLRVDVVAAGPVNEASPYAFFTVTGTAGENLFLTLGNTAITTDQDATISGFTVEYSIDGGTTWLTYSTGDDDYSVPVIPGSGSVLVRVNIASESDTVFEGPETFTLTGSIATGAGATSTATTTIVDNGTGVKYPGTLTGSIPTTDTTNLDDDRALAVNSITVNEASPFAVFTVTGVAGQQVQLALANGTATSPADFGTALEYWNGSAWVSYTPGSFVAIPAGGTTLLVRNPIVNDATFEGPETFTLTATNTGGTGNSGTATIVDNGTGVKFPGTVTGGVPTTDTTNLDDDRALAVNSITVNEASPFAVFTVTGVAGQQVQLALANGTATSPTDFGTALEYWNGSAWVSYTPGSFVAIPAGGTTLLVRNPIVNDATFEGPETFTLTATNTGGTGNSGTATIVDNGTGVKFPGTVTGGVPTTDTTNLDDDRALAVNSITVNEASPFAVFTVTGVAGQQVQLALSDGTATSPADFGAALEYWNGSAWVSYTPGSFVAIPAGGTTLLVRNPIINDATFEGPETFTLTATNTGGTGNTGTATIVDNGTGVKYPGTLTGGVPTTDTTNLDDDREFGVSSIVVNEASPYAVFTITAEPGKQVTLALSDGTATSPADFGTALEYWNGTAWVNYTAGTLITISASRTLLVRNPLVNDTTFEGPETFTLAATNDLGAVVTGTATIVDDGTGVKYPGTVTGGLPTADTTNLDDDRELAVNSITVNEASPFAVFTVTGGAGQQVQLALSDGTATSPADFGTALEYWNGSAWVSYAPGSFVAIPAGGTTLLVRNPIINDATFEGPETFTLTATNTGGTGNTGTATIVDNGTGVKYPGTVTGGVPTTDTTNLDDDRELGVNNITVNEGSPYAVFTVTGEAGKGITLALVDGAAKISDDYGPGLEYWNGTSWENYSAGAVITLPLSRTLLVRTAILNDSIFEGPETFSLTATNDVGTVATGTATVVDDGTGVKFPDMAPDPSGNPVTNTTNLDNDLRVNVAAIGPVNEASPYAFFTVTGTVGQPLSLALGNTATTADKDATIGGFTMQYSTDGGATWQLYSKPPIIPSSGTVLVRVNITSEADTTFEGPETFTLTGRIATGAGATSTATATIVDNGTGSRYPGTVTGGVPNRTTINLDDDRLLSVNNITVNEASPYAVFTVTGATGQQVKLALAGGTATPGADFGTALQYWNGTSWVNYTANSFVPIPPGGTTLLVRTTIINDTLFEGAETFRLTATNTGGTGRTGTATIRDDGAGVKYPGTVSGGVPVTNTTNLDNDSSPVNVPPVTVGTIANRTNNDGATIAPLDIRSFFRDPNGDRLTYSVRGLPTGLRLDPATGIISGTINRSASQGGSNGLYTTVITANDGKGGTTSQTFTWQVSNPLPIAVNDRASVTEDRVLRATGNLMANDRDPDGDPISVINVRGNTTGRVVGTYGTLVWGANGTYTYTLNNALASVQRLGAGQTVNDVFAYTIRDRDGGTARANLTVAVNGTNDAPLLDLNGSLAGTGHTTTYNAALGRVAIAPTTVRITDADSPRLVSATITLTNRLNGNAERLVAGLLPPGITARAYNPTTGQLVLTGSATLAAYQAAIAAITYQNTALYPSRQNRTIQVVVNDGRANSNLATTVVRWSNEFYGTNGNDIINGSSGSISGLSSTNVFYAGGGDDIVNGGSNVDLIYGGTGNDILNGGGGNDRVYGEAGDDILNGGTGDDYLNGGTGNDILNGGSGNDTLIGGAGNDILNGGSGNDILVGGPGSDRLTGGQGRDIFRFNAVSEGLDTITDFEILQDRIDLSQIAGLRWGNVGFQQRGSDTLLSVTMGGQNQPLATLLNVNANTLTAQHVILPGQV